MMPHPNNETQNGTPNESPIRRQRRKNWAQTALRIGLAVLVLDAIAYAALERPLAGLLAHKQDQFTATRLAWRQEKAQLAALESRNAALPRQDQQLRDFLRQHLPPQREGFSSAALLIERLTQQSEVQLSGVSYRADRNKGEPLEHLGLSVNVQGPFPALLSFARALETSQNLVIVRRFKFESAGPGVLGLRLNADLYLMP
ncbi:MAG: hypothetical protein ACRD4Q_01470 [Candidatus Acidiferrales bacterium]